MIKNILLEFRDHVPFTFFATLSAVVLVYLTADFLVPEYYFEFFHFLHIIASAIVSASLFYRYDNKFWSAMVIGVFGALFFGSLSDVVLPYSSSLLLGVDTHFHLPLAEQTLLVVSLAIFGSLIGILTKVTKVPHFVHVFLSVFASLFYLLAFGGVGFLLAVVIVFISVIIPCCLSDIVFPLLFINKKI